MDEQRRIAIENLKTASPLEATKYLQQLELYDAKSSQKIIDEVYQQFASGENIKDEVLKPVFLSVIDGLLEATPSGRAARRKGLTASRVFKECENFSYSEEANEISMINGYDEFKNARDALNETQNNIHEYNSENRKKYFEDKKAMDKYKEDRIIGEKTLVDEYTGKKNLYHKQSNPNLKYNDETHRMQAQPDHIVPLKQIHNELNNNYALDDSDIKKIANIDDNFAVTSAEINQVKKELSNKEYIDWMDENDRPLDEQTRQNMLNLQREAQSAVTKQANKKVFDNLAGKADVDSKTLTNAINDFKATNNGRTPTKEELIHIRKQISKHKTNEIRNKSIKNATSQAKDYAVGNLILFIVKPVYYEISDIFKNGFKDGVNASGGIEAISLRFQRIKRYVLAHAKGFLGDSFWEFVKGFVSSLIEGIISLFVGIFKQVLKIIKEGIKIFVQSSKILFGKDSSKMSPAEKGDAIIKLLGGSIIAIAGIGIEALLNKIGIGEPWSIVLSTMLSGIASALFMYLLNKVDLFSVKAEKRRNRILEIFRERIQDINEAAETCSVVSIETFRRQRMEYDALEHKINNGIKNNNILEINDGLYHLANFMKVDLPYTNTDEFCDYMDSETSISL